MRAQFRRLLTNGPLLTAVVVTTTLGFHALYVLPQTRRLAQWLMQEDLVVEDITFVALFAASVLSVLLARRTHRDRQSALATWFFVALAAGLLVVAMEEISWGQWLFFFKTPGSWKAINRQGETNLHNLDGLWGLVGMDAARVRARGPLRGHRQPMAPASADRGATIDARLVRLHDVVRGR